MRHYARSMQTTVVDLSCHLICRPDFLVDLWRDCSKSCRTSLSAACLGFCHWSVDGILSWRWQSVEILRNVQCVSVLNYETGMNWFEELIERCVKSVTQLLTTFGIQQPRKCLNRLTLFACEYFPQFLVSRYCWCCNCCGSNWCLNVADVCWTRHQIRILRPE